MMMPEMDGYQALQTLRKIERLATLPVISVTAQAMKGDREKCLEAGATDYISKPVDADLLLNMLTKYLQN
jgi:CheY-like chemotaxis protein